MRRPLHLLLAILLLVLVGGLAVGCGDDEPSDKPPAADETPSEDSSDTGEEDSDEENSLAAAGIDPTTGAFQGLEPDDRQGTAPPASSAGSLEQAARAAGCKLRLNLADELAPINSSRTHLAPGEAPPDYGTNPATSGRHDPVPIADGSYRDTPPEQNVVHSLEHGRVAIQYAPSLSEADQLVLKGVFDADPDGMLLFTNPDMPDDVAVTAWTNRMSCKTVSNPEALAAAVIAFRDSFRGKGPERIPL